jgi:hypothetical protein
MATVTAPNSLYALRDLPDLSAYRLGNVFVLFIHARYDALNQPPAGTPPEDLGRKFVLTSTGQMVYAERATIEALRKKLPNGNSLSIDFFSALIHTEEPHFYRLATFTPTRELENTGKETILAAEAFAGITDPATAFVIGNQITVLLRQAKKGQQD